MNFQYTLSIKSPLLYQVKVFLVIGAKGIYNGSTLNTACQEISLLENGNSFRWGSSPALLERVFLERVETFLGYVVLVKQQDCQENFSALEGMCLCLRGSMIT